MTTEDNLRRFDCTKCNWQGTTSPIIDNWLGVRCPKCGGEAERAMNPDEQSTILETIEP